MSEPTKLTDEVLQELEQKADIGKNALPYVETPSPCPSCDWDVGFICPTCGLAESFRDITRHLPALLAAARRLREVEGELQDCGMMIRRLLRQCDNEELKSKALDFIKRKGLQGSVLRTMGE